MSRLDGSNYKFIRNSMCINQYYLGNKMITILGESHNTVKNNAYYNKIYNDEILKLKLKGYNQKSLDNIPYYSVSSFLQDRIKKNTNNGNDTKFFLEFPLERIDTKIGSINIKEILDDKKILDKMEAVDFRSRYINLGLYYNPKVYNLDAEGIEKNFLTPWLKIREQEERLKEYNEAMVTLFTTEHTNDETIIEGAMLLEYITNNILPSYLSTNYIETTRRDFTDEQAISLIKKLKDIETYRAAETLLTFEEKSDMIERKKNMLREYNDKMFFDINFITNLNDRYKWLNEVYDDIYKDVKILATNPEDKVLKNTIIQKLQYFWSYIYDFSVCINIFKDITVTPGKKEYIILTGSNHVKNMNELFTEFKFLPNYELVKHTPSCDSSKQNFIFTDKIWTL